MRRTGYAELSDSPEELGIVPQPPLELPLPQDVTGIALSDPAEIQVPALELRTAIAERRTLRKYSEAALTLDELAYLLWATQGVKKVTSRPVTLRTVPSAGARHAVAFELEDAGGVAFAKEFVCRRVVDGNVAQIQTDLMPLVDEIAGALHNGQRGKP